MTTLPELEAMSDDELRVMLSDILNWKLFKGVQPFMWGPGYKVASHDYPQDLNACHAVEETLEDAAWERYSQTLYDFCTTRVNPKQVPDREIDPVHAKPRFRAIALIFTLQP